jgi:hypothetical protein
MECSSWVGKPSLICTSDNGSLCRPAREKSGAIVERLCLTENSVSNAFVWTNSNSHQHALGRDFPPVSTFDGGKHVTIAEQLGARKSGRQGGEKMHGVSTV